MKKHVLAIGLCMLLSVASMAGASGPSQVLVARGLVALSTEQLAQARQLFAQAVAVDATDVQARYYLAVVHERMGEPVAAIAALKMVLAREPTFDLAALDLGVLLLQRGEYRDASAWLTHAQKNEGLRAKALLFQGVVSLRLGDVPQAQRQLEHAALSDASLRPTARYYQGVLAFQDGNWQAAQAHLTFVREMAPGTEMAREAEALLTQVAQRSRGVAYRLYGVMSLQHDTNVLLAPADDSIAQDLDLQGASDQRGTVKLGGAVVPWQWRQVRATLAYDFFQSVHVDHAEFDMQSHGVSAELAGRSSQFPVPLSWSILGRYGFYLLDFHSFLRGVTVQPRVTLHEAAWSETEVAVSVRQHDFYARPFKDDPGPFDFNVLDGWNIAPTLRQRVYFDGREQYVWVGYQYRRDDLRGDPVSDDKLNFSYTGHRGELGAQWRMPAGVLMNGRYTYHDKDYRYLQFNGDIEAPRRDDEHRFMLTMRRPLNAHVSVIAGYLGILNDSTHPDFEYNRHIALLSVEVRN